MALNQTNIPGQGRPPRSWIASLSTDAEFLCAALVGAVCLAGLASYSLGAPTAAFATALFALAAGVTGFLLQRSDYPHDRLGLCNYVTLLRLCLVCILVALIFMHSGPSWVVFGIAILALALDGIDGWLARRQGLASKFGARFDVEVDSLLALLLAINAALNPEFSAAVLLLGVPRYAYVAGTVVWPWLNNDLPERFSRKLVCVVQIAVLIALQAPILPTLAATLLIPVAALALIWSFAVDIIWLWQARK